ncbi:MAG: hypothetical protein CMJ31_06545 [Phycisphaerae bacterium]|nr:hypothetical protein [Phycisphaerae bacterium]
MRFVARRGLTLLELMVALVIVASVTTLVAALWGQLAAWSRTQTGLHDTLRAHRFEDLAARQWSERVKVGAAEDRAGRAISRLSTEELSFVTSLPIIDPDSPLVLATYRVAHGVDGSARLEYVEQRLAFPGAAPQRPAPGVELSAGMHPRTLVVHEDVGELRWQRWVNTIEDDARVRGWFEVDADSELEPLESEAPYEPDDDEAESSATLVESADDGDDDEEGPRAPDAVRLVGEIEGRGFAWIFAEDASR